MPAMKFIKNYCYCCVQRQYTMMGKAMGQVALDIREAVEDICRGTQSVKLKLKIFIEISGRSIRKCVGKSLSAMVFTKRC